MKALFFDIDGTLVDLQSGVAEVPQGVVRQLERIRSLGHRTFISSGRPLPFVGEEFRSLGFDGYVMLNGAQVEAGGQTIYEERMDPEAAWTVARLHEEAGAGYAIDTAHHVFIDPSFDDALGFLAAHRPFITCDFDRDHALGRALKIESSPTQEQRDHIACGLESCLGDAVTCDDNGTDKTFEVYSSRLSKATGIARVLDHLGIARKDAYGFGDGLNDLDMIRACGVGVAMGNAVDELKAEADIVCGRVDEDGLENILRELF